MTKFGKHKISSSGIEEAIGKVVKGRRNPEAFLRQLDTAAKEEGATNAERKAVVNAMHKRLNSHIKQAKAGFDKAGADIKAGNLNYLKKSLTPEKVAAMKESFSGAVASVLHDMMNLEESQEGKPYGGSKKLKEATDTAIRAGRGAAEYAKSRKKKAAGGKVYTQSRNKGGPIRKPRMK